MGARLVIRSIDGRTVEEEVGYPFDQGRVVIGRGRSTDVRVPHRTVSELHATLRQDGSEFSLCDEGSTNGTRVNGEALVPHRSRRLYDGDMLEVGVYLLSFHTDVLITQPLSADRTGELARQLLRQGRGQSRGLPQPPTLAIVSGPASGRTLRLGTPPARYLIGRAQSCQLVLPDTNLADEQLELVHDLDGARLRDLGGQASIELSGQRLVEHRLRDGDELRVGDTRLLFEEPADARLEALALGDDDALPSDYRAQPQPPPEAERAPQPEAPVPPPVVAPRKRAAGASTGADLIIYCLAAAILALSVAALVVLMGAH